VSVAGFWITIVVVALIALLLLVALVVLLARPADGKEQHGLSDR